ncbi:hypothetical protein M422DRAFT_147121, partial [Sphaerobolus stellatus SS14]
NRQGLRHQCMPGTREDVISTIMQWATNEDSSPICWFNGPAGFGKSAIVQTVAERLAARDKLAASFFFLRGAGLRAEFRRFLTTLAYHMTISIPATKSVIQEALQRDPALPNYSIQDQFQQLIIAPVQGLIGQNIPNVVVIDALDECTEAKSIQDFISLLICLSSNGSCLLRFLLASRGEDHIRNVFEVPDAKSVTKTVELEQFNSVNDIHAFLKAHFANILNQNPRVFQGISEKWPSAEQLKELTKKSSGVFIFAATVVNFIAEGKKSPQQRLEQVLETHTGLDPLYKQVLKAASWDEDFNKVLTVIILLHEQLSIAALSDLIEIRVEDIVSHLLEIQSIVKIPATNNGIVQLNHVSLRDFLLDKERSKEYHIKAPFYHAIIFKHCLTRMTRTLKYDNFPWDIATRYACKRWHYHLRDAIDWETSSRSAELLNTDLQLFLRSEALEPWINTIV